MVYSQLGFTTILVVTFILSYIRYCEGLKCYECVTEGELLCDTERKKIKECKDDENFCVTITIEASGEAEYKKVQKCAPASQCENSNGKGITCSLCSVDLCNQAVTVKPSALHLIGCIMMYLLVRLYRC